MAKKFLDYDGLAYVFTKVKSMLSGKADSSHTHAATDITSGTLAVARGGTGVTANPSMLTNLGSTTAASVFAASPRPGVTGTLPIANGGTGATTATAALTALGAAASSHAHAATDITSGTLAVARGGTGVTSNPSMLTNLGSTTAASVFAASPRPGVTGTLPVANGGTGNTSVDTTPTSGSTKMVTSGGVYTALSGKADTSALSGYLPLTGGELTGALTVAENFHVTKDLDSVNYSSYLKPVNYAIGDEYSTGIIHYNAGTSNAQLMFNKNGIYLRDNVTPKVYQLFGQHNTDTLKTVVESFGAAKVEIVSYTGTGTYGSDNPNSVTFSFTPTYVLFVGHKLVNSSTHGSYVGTHTPFVATPVTLAAWGDTSKILSTILLDESEAGSNTTVNSDMVLIPSFSGNTMSWYNTESRIYQRNVKNDIYYVVGIG